MSEAGYPDDLLYHPEHDWARIDAAQPHEATLGITWYAQDALGEVVFFEAPAVGTLLVQGAPYAEVESVKAVSDVVAPLSGEIVAVNDTLEDSPAADQRGPLRRRLDGAHRPERSGRARRADGRRRLFRHAGRLG